MSDTGFKFLAIAATFSVASSMVATAAAEPDRGVPYNVAKPTLLAGDSHKEHIDIHSRGGVKAAPAQTSDKQGPGCCKAAPIEGGGARGKGDKR